MEFKRVTFKRPKDYKDADYFKLLNGEMGKVVRKNQKVAVVGAGMAGLVAAWLLKDAGFAVTVFEASLRVGGRVKTLREGFSSGLYAEAGAMRIPNGHKLTLRLCEKLGLKEKLYRFPEHEGKARVFINRLACELDEYEKGNAYFDSPYSKGCNTKAVFSRTIDRLKSYYEDEEKHPLLDQMSLGEYLRQFVEPRGRKNQITEEPIEQKDAITPSDIDLVGFEHGASELRASLLEVIRDRAALSSAKWQIEGGMDLLPRELVSQKNLTDNIRFHSRVISIKDFTGPQKGYELNCENPITRARSEDIRAQSEDRRFDFVVLAAPFSALTHVTLDKVLRPEKMHAIRNLHYDNATKIILEFTERFWESLGIKNGGRSFTDLPIRWVHYPAPRQHPKNSKRGILLASYTWGEDSLRWGSLNPDDRINFALRDVASLHDIDEDKLKRLLVGGMSHSWAEDEYTFGAFALFDPHQETDMFNQIWQPHKGIHFAGEHASMKHGWIEGAVESGIRVAKEIFDAANGVERARRATA